MNLSTSSVYHSHNDLCSQDLSSGAERFVVPLDPTLACTSTPNTYEHPSQSSSYTPNSH